MSALYSLTPERKASKKAINHFVLEAVKRKKWAESLEPIWFEQASVMSVEWVKTLKKKSTKTIARENLDYARMRAHMGFVYGNYPMDKPAYDLWYSLNN